MHDPAVVPSWATVKEIVRSERIQEGSESGGNDRTADLAWAAGFFDGEGYIGINSARRSKTPTRAFTLVLSMAQVDPRPLEDFRQIVGLGPIGRYGSSQPNHSPKSIWSSSGQQAAAVLRQLLPYFRHKREQAEIAIAFQATKVHNGLRLTDAQYEAQRVAREALRSIRASFKVGANS